MAAEEALLLLYELIDAAEDLAVVHGASRRVTRQPLHDSHDHAGGHRHHGHGHSHGLVDASIKRSREGLMAVGLSLAVLGLAACAQTVIFVASGSIALLADLIHNFGDAGTAIPLGIAFLLRSARAERWAGLFVVAAIFFSACVAGFEAITRLIHPRPPPTCSPWPLAGLIGFAGNWVAAGIRTRAGQATRQPGADRRRQPRARRLLRQPGGRRNRRLRRSRLPVADPLIGLAITAVILKITWDSWQTVRGGDAAWQP